jgi:hypothetical protein
MKQTGRREQYYHRPVEARAIAKGRADGLPEMFKRDIERARNLAREFMNDHGKRFEEMSRDFFFIDLDPENDARFDVKLDDCFQADGPGSKAQAPEALGCREQGDQRCAEKAVGSTENDEIATGLAAQHRDEGIS